MSHNQIMRNKNVFREIHSFAEYESLIRKQMKRQGLPVNTRVISKVLRDACSFRDKRIQQKKNRKNRKRGKNRKRSKKNRGASRRMCLRVLNLTRKVASETLAKKRALKNIPVIPTDNHSVRARRINFITNRQRRDRQLLFMRRRGMCVISTNKKEHQ